MNIGQDIPRPVYTYVGIDVSKDTLDIHDRGRHSTINNDRGAVRRRCKQIARIGEDGTCPPPMVVLEATGAYERLLTRELDRAGVPHRRCNPRQVREHARSTGQLAKSDRIDSGCLTSFGDANRLQPRPSAPETTLELRSLEDARAALVEDRKSWTNRLKQDLGAAMERIAGEHIAHLDASIEKIEGQIAAAVASDSLLAERAAILEGVCGIGATTASALLAYLPELGSLNVKSVANLSGVAPHACESGTMKGRRICWGGRAVVRRVLYMPVLTAVRHNPVIRESYTSMIANGKPPKVALVAMMRKLLIHLNSLLKGAQHECYETMGK